jgi:hypothetical protein
MLAAYSSQSSYELQPSSQTILTCGEEAIGDGPAASQLLSAGFAGTIEKLLQIPGIVNVECDAGKLQYLARFSCVLSGGEVRPETIVAET